VTRSDGDEVLEGVLLCPEPLCRREHPVIDGIPVLVADLGSWASHQAESVLQRDDVSPFMVSLLGDASGPASRLVRERTNLSGYGHGHWGEGGFGELVGEALALLDAPVAGAWIDVGCAVGRGTLELARGGAEVAVGVDLSFGMLRVAERMRREGVAAWPQRRVGIVFDERSVAVGDVPADRLGFWCADTEVLPFADGAFAGALSLNVLDCVRSPLGHLLELGRVLEPEGDALLSTPYDWSVTATPLEGWIGGHSQRGPAEGSSEAELRRILAQDAAAGIDTGLTIAAERDRVPWRVHATDRSRMEYELHLLRLRRGA
jgi:SAM-dependent methyltransferase